MPCGFDGHSPDTESKKYKLVRNVGALGAHCAAHEKPWTSRAQMREGS